jgi:hypothetical protein
LKPGKRSDIPVVRGSESNEAFTDNQPQYPDFQSYFKARFKGLQDSFATTPNIPDLTRHAHGYYPVIEEIVEGFVSFEGRPARKLTLSLWRCKLFLRNSHTTAISGMPRRPTKANISSIIVDTFDPLMNANLTKNQYIINAPHTTAPAKNA